MLSARSQLYLSTTLLLLAVGFYVKIYFRSISESISSSHFSFAESSSAHQQPNLAFALNPDEHVYREPSTIHHVWNITSGLRAPDGVTKRVYLINGQCPGPLIEARSGDEIVIEINNGLDKEWTAVHWHGLSMRGANDMDGVVGLTQCDISPGKSFTYKFKIQDDQAGTFWYHAHSDLQRADGLYGGFVVHRPADSVLPEIEYEQDLALMIGDWYHRSAQEVQDYYTDWTNFGLEPAPDSMVLNGRGVFNCSMEIPARPIECSKVKIPQLRLAGDRTRLRIINTGALAGFTISISGHGMTLFKIDGGNAVDAVPSAKSIGVLYPGERMDVIVEQLGPGEVKNPVLTIKLDRENLKFKNFALTPIQHFPVSSSGKPRERPLQADGLNQPISFFNLANASGSTLPENNMPTTADELILLYTKIEILSEFRNIPKGFINRTSWGMTRASPLPLLALNRHSWGKAFVPKTRSGPNVWVDIVLNNMDDRGHPFHLHGNNFYVLATHKATAGSYDAFNPFENSTPAGEPLNTLNPVMKDTVFVPRMGYVVLRFKADNEGLWFFHCHILMHQAVGMAMAVQVGGDEMGIAGYRESSKELCQRSRRLGK